MTTKQNIWIVPFVPKNKTIKPRTLAQYLRENYENTFLTTIVFGCAGVVNKLKFRPIYTMMGLTATIGGHYLRKYGKDNSITYTIDKQKYTPGNLAMVAGKIITNCGLFSTIFSIVKEKPTGFLFNLALMNAAISGGCAFGAQYYRQNYEIDHNGTSDIILSKSVGAGLLTTTAIIYGTNLISRLIKPGNSHIKCWHSPGTLGYFLFFIGCDVLSTIGSVYEYKENMLSVYH